MPVLTAPEPTSPSFAKWPVPSSGEEMCTNGCGNTAELTVRVAVTRLCPDQHIPNRRQNTILSCRRCSVGAKPGLTNKETLGDGSTLTTRLISIDRLPTPVPTA